MDLIDTSLIVVPPENNTKGTKEYFKIIYGNREITNVINLDQSIIDDFQCFLDNTKKSETFLIEASRNFIRKFNFLELTEDLENGEISEDQYNLELSQKSENYMITLRDFNSPSDVLIIAELIEKIGSDLKDFSTSEIAEMFSVKENQLISFMESNRNQLKLYEKIR